LSGTLIRLWVDCGRAGKLLETSIAASPRLNISNTWSNPPRSLKPSECRKAACGSCARGSKRHQLALDGNDRLLQKLLEAKKPDEYGNKVRVDFTATLRRLTEAQINQRASASISMHLSRQMLGNRRDVKQRRHGRT
jgi:hypothetical protein